MSPQGVRGHYSPPPRQPSVGKLKGGGFGFCSFPSSPSVLAIGGYYKSGGYSMNNKENKRYYTPQFSSLASISVRRLAWAMGISMPAAINILVRLLPTIVDPSKVCSFCKDKTKCQGCSFNNKTPPKEQDFLSLFTQKEQEAIAAVF